MKNNNEIDHWITWRGKHLPVDKDGNIIKIEKEEKSYDEINKEYKEIKRQLYSTDYQKSSEELDSLYKKYKELGEKRKQLKNKQEETQKQNEIITDELFENKKDDIVSEIRSVLATIESEDDGIYGIREKDITENTYFDFLQKASEQYRNEIIDDEMMDKIEGYYLDNISKYMKELGYDLEYINKKNEYYYTKLSGANDAYSNIIRDLENNNINYKISRSVNAGELPSIYIQDEDENIFRIGNHYNSNYQEWGRKGHNKIYTTNEYIDYKNTIYKDLYDELGIKLNFNEKDLKTATKKLPNSKEYKETAYHSSNAFFTEFDTTKIGTGQGENTMGNGINLANNAESVKDIYGKNLYEVEVNLKNAYTVPDKQILSTFKKDFGRSTDIDNISSELSKMGYDGIVSELWNDNKLYTVFDSKNVSIKKINNKKVG